MLLLRYGSLVQSKNEFSFTNFYNFTTEEAFIEWWKNFADICEVKEVKIWDKSNKCLIVDFMTKEAFKNSWFKK
jgi:hypothetical protein